LRKSDSTDSVQAGVGEKEAAIPPSPSASAEKGRRTVLQEKREKPLSGLEIRRLIYLYHGFF
jgi:hypothetical protein